MIGLDIRYSVANAAGQPTTSDELVVTNWDAQISWAPQARTP
jgi:hypothetical protein